jgi:hypothetical protein
MEPQIISEEESNLLDAQRVRFSESVTRMRESYQEEVDQLRAHLIDLHRQLEFGATEEDLLAYVVDIVGQKAIDESKVVDPELL